jgi:hypothetical protein
MLTNPDNFPLSSLIEAASFAPQWLKEPYSWVGHIPFVSWLVQVDKPKIIVELGTHSGNSYFSICQAVKRYETDSKCFAVDTWQGDAHALSYGEEVYEMVRIHNEEYYASFSTLLRMTFDEALSHFEDHSVDLLHIDGLHTYEAVKHDFETWLPKLAPGAIVLFHDTNVKRDDFGVWKFWSELKKKYHNTFEFTHSFGLGVLKINSSTGGNDFKNISEEKTIRFFKSCGKVYDDYNFVDELTRNKIPLPWQFTAMQLSIESLNGKIISIQNSLSWRVTKPLRWVDKVLRHIL